MKRKGFVILVVLTVFAITGLFVLKGQKDNAQSVSIIKIRRQTADSSVYCNGIVEQERIKNILTNTTVAIKKVCIKEGDYVKEGDILFEIDSDTSRKEIFSEDSTNYEDARNVKDKICAEISGYIHTVTAEKDTVCPKDYSLATIIPEKSLQARINISEDLVPCVAVGQAVELTGSGFGDKIYEGEIKSITAFAKPLQIGNSTQTVLEAIVDIKRPDRDLKVGFNVKAKISVDKVNDAIIIPFDAVSQNDEGKQFVYIIKGNKAYKKRVKTGEEYDDGIRVVSGVNIGDEIVCDNNLTGDAVAVSIAEGAR